MVKQHELDEIKRVVRLAVHLPKAIRLRTLQLVEIERRISIIEQRMCTGTPYWRDDNDSNRKPKLYANHSLGESCPIHGKPADPRKRIRAYIGTNEHAIVGTLAAMDKHVYYKQLLRARQRVASSLLIHASLTTLYRWMDFDYRSPLVEQDDWSPLEHPPQVLQTDLDQINSKALERAYDVLRQHT